MSELADGTPNRRLWLVTFTAVLVAVVLSQLVAWTNLSRPLCCDAYGYAAIAEQMRVAGGIGFRYELSDVRTYGYPWLLSHLFSFASVVGVARRWVTFEFQLIFYITAAWMLSAAIRKFSKTTAIVGFCALLVNYSALVYATEVLTESVSLSLILITCACWLRWLASNCARGYVWVALGALAAGFAMAIRPANVFMAPVYVSALVLGAIWHNRHCWWVALLRGVALSTIAATVLILPLIPQRLYNRTFHNSNSWLMATDLGEAQMRGGITHIKYATAVPPNSDVSIYYGNPCFDSFTTVSTPAWRWYLKNPFEALCTAALHLFGLLDQDLLFTYVVDLDPWYRIPWGVICHSSVFLAAWFFFRAVRFTWGQDSILIGRLFVTVIGLYILSFLAVHVPSRVEVRFGLPLYLLVFPLAGLALAQLAAQCWSVRLRVLTLMLAYAFVSLCVSHWVRLQAPLLQ